LSGAGAAKLEDVAFTTKDTKGTKVCEVAGKGSYVAPDRTLDKSGA